VTALALPHCPFVGSSEKERANLLLFLAKVVHFLADRSFLEVRTFQIRAYLGTVSFGVDDELETFFQSSRNLCSPMSVRG
jgi:hypothetical protein